MSKMISDHSEKLCQTQYSKPWLLAAMST